MIQNIVLVLRRVRYESSIEYGMWNKKYSQALQVTFLISKIFSDFFDPELE